ncbi:Uncharacterised protein [Mycobacteroides abscessus subsp. abscessus]|nr:Uncharacterised protein [Mycobacteroides abscessus subsp. abscessus]
MASIGTRMNRPSWSPTGPNLGFGSPKGNSPSLLRSSAWVCSTSGTPKPTSLMYRISPTPKGRSIRLSRTLRSISSSTVSSGPAK